jgi:hypothetical protein
VRLYKKVIITGCKADDLKGVPYLTRWRLIESRFGAVYLHKFHRSDGKDLHDHPWAFCSIILWRGYIEEVKLCEYCEEGTIPPMPYAVPSKGDSITCQFCFGNYNSRKRVWPGMILYRKASHIHRVELIGEKPAWTLIVRGPYVRTWGYWVDGIWEDFKSYFVRRGC